MILGTGPLPRAASASHLTLPSLPLAAGWSGFFCRRGSFSGGLGRRRASSDPAVCWCRSVGHFEMMSQSTPKRTSAPGRFNLYVGL